MRCDEARQLFDAYLDGELSPALATELGAHRLRCPECRRALALLEVTGHIVASDQDPVAVGEGLTDRLLACMEQQQIRWPHRIRRVLYIGGPLAAAAVICLAFLGVFDRERGQALGEKDWAEPAAIKDILTDDTETEGTDQDDSATLELDRLGQQFQRNLDSKRHSVESLQQARDMTVGQFLDVLEQAKDKSTAQDHFPGADPTTEPAASETVPLNGDDVGDS
jgi:hypothetical protein